MSVKPGRPRKKTHNNKTLGNTLARRMTVEKTRLWIVRQLRPRVGLDRPLFRPQILRVGGNRAILLGRNRTA
jgi:hypothetical protein